jgi:hypothetical protein
MATFAVHSSSGEIDAIVIASEGAPPVAAAEPGQVVSEVDLPSGLTDVTDAESERRVAESLKDYRVQGTMTRRS